jgi:putative Mn2+ efflux pump MntP
VVALAVVAVGLGLSNFAAAIGIGTSGGPRVRVAVVFGLFEAGMPLVGLALGHGAAGSLGGSTRWLGGAILIAVGGYGLAQGRRSPWPAHSPDSLHSPSPAHSPDSLHSPRPAHSPSPDSARGWRLVVTGLALSVDNLAAGFALGTYHVPIVLAAVLIGVVSAAMSLAGMELGARLGTAIGRRADLAAGAILVAVGITIAAGWL